MMPQLQDVAQIRRQTQLCMGLFSAGTEALQNYRLQSVEAIQALEDPLNDDSIRTLETELFNEHARLSLWSSNIGVFAEIQSSLDFRIRDETDLQQAFIGHLETIEYQMNLFNEALEIASKKSANTSSEISQYSQDLRQILETVHSHCDWLHKLSNLIRKASLNRQNERSDNFMWSNSEGQRSREMTEDVTGGMKRYFTYLVEREITGEEDRTEHPTEDAMKRQRRLIERLVQSMVIRHKRVLYRRSRQVSYSAPPTKNLSQPILREIAPTTRPAFSEGPSRSNLVAPRFDNPQETATTIDKQDLRRLMVSPSIVTRGTADPVGTHDDLYAPPPTGAKEGKEFICPYCCLIIQGTKGDPVRAWREHVSKDLTPFVCIFDDCEQDSPVLYSSKKQWLLHMSSQHRQEWRCTSKEHGSLQFDHPDMYADHLKSHHGDEILEDQIRLLVEVQASPIVPTLEHCPFCSETQGDLAAHIGRHLKRFALYSLPLPEDSPVDDPADTKSQRLSSISENTTSSRSLKTVNSWTSDQMEDYGTEFENNRYETFSDIPSVQEQHRPLDTELTWLEADKTLQSFACAAYDVSSIQELRYRYSAIVLPKVTVDFYPASNKAVPVKDFFVTNNPVPRRIDTLTSSTQNQDSDSDQDQDATLGDVIRDCGVPHIDGVENYFWPSKLLREVLTVQRIKTELDGYASTFPNFYREDTNTQLAKRIREEYIIVFALLCLLSKGYCIQQFIDEQVKDNHLPFWTDRRGGCKLYRARANQVIRSFQKSQIMAVLWNIHEREYVLSHQDSFRPVVFGWDQTGGAQHRDFDTEVILPFMRPHTSSATQQGGFATVDQVEVHPYCHSFHDILPSIKTKNLFALKKLHIHPNRTQEERQKEFEKEVGMLNRFADLRHDHLVRLLASWSRPRNLVREYCLLFPLAACDLDLYWEQHSMSDTTIRWIAKQILGLTDALRRIHDPPSEALKPQDQRRYGRHGDLKPENILWYDSPHDPHGILVIADLGASAVNSLWSRSAVENKAIQHTPRYKPPECDLEGGKISRSYDIWTFGCILLELVCWCLEGKDGRQAFFFERFAPYPTGLQTDMFFDIKPAMNKTYVVLIKEGVTKRIASLHRHPGCTEFLHDLLYLIEEQMIVAISEKTNRTTSARLYDTVRSMNSRMDRDQGYYQKPCRMPRPAKQFDPVQAVFQDHLVGQIQSRVQGLGIHRGSTQRTKSVQQLRNMEYE